MNIPNKKGEITTAQIVTIIVLIVSFIVLLFFFFRLNLGATTNSEICHNSVVLKARSVGLSGDLECRTGYVCISDGGTCSDVNPTETIAVDSGNKAEIMEALADKMSECWWMFGEGQLDYLGTSPNNICGICSIVSFDEKVISSNSITYSEFYDYLASTKKDDSQTYLTYLYGIYDVETLLEQDSFLRENIGNNILVADKYALITGESKTIFTLRNGKYLAPSFIKTSEISKYLQNDCQEFITEA